MQMPRETVHEDLSWNRRKRTEDTEDNMVASDCSGEHDDPAVSIEGTLLIRKGKATGNSTWKWKLRWVVFRFDEGGSIAIYKRNRPQSDEATVLNSFRSNLHRRNSTSNLIPSTNRPVPELDLPSDLHWIVKDIPQDPSTFVLEISTGSQEWQSSVGDDTFSLESGFPGNDETSTELNDILSLDGIAANPLIDEINHAQSLNKPYRLYFQCYHNPDEKALWLKAFSNVGRLSNQVRDKSSIVIRSLSTYRAAASRVRNKKTARIAQEARQLDQQYEQTHQNLCATVPPTRDVEFLVRGRRHATNKEFRCQPAYAYPHRWMTKAEMREEMLLPSDHVHDLRVPNCQQREIGSLQVEVLQCLGLPRLDRGSDSDAVVYLVCGSYAFCTDIIYSRANPMWLRKSRRACEFPLFHGYARLYVGVFDDEPRKVKDDFAGRVVLDLARLRPRSTYDVTLPLRLSTHVYTRRRRGAIRLRFTVRWKTERSALLSYLPRTLKIPLPQHSRPDFSTTVLCTDQKAFRNIAITVHGAHLPGRFTFTQLRAVIREINFTRKFVFSTLLQTIHSTRRWQNPATSAFVFLSWMHCIYANSFSLVPAYIMLYLFLIMMQNYARYSMDGPSQRGFVPPSWEELLLALIRGGSDPHDPAAISPLSLTVDHTREDVDSAVTVQTHEPKGKKLFEALGFSRKNSDPNRDHLEFAFANGSLYPKFTVEESLVLHGKDKERSTAQRYTGDPNQSNSGDPENVKNRFKVDVDWMKKDASGTKEFDEEIGKFRAVGAVISKGAY